jgi:hypothetical protein
MFILIFEHRGLLQWLLIAFSLFPLHLEGMVAFMVVPAPTQQLAVLLVVLMLHLCFVPHVGYVGQCGRSVLADEYVGEHDGVVIGVSVVSPPADGFFLIFLLLHNSPI